MADPAPDKVKFAGDVRLDDVTIITTRGFAQEITPQVIGLEIYEDMFAPFITGKIILKDSQELSNLLPLIGEEYVRLKVNTPGLPDADGYNMEFMIYKMDDRMRAKEREVIYVLHFISKEAIVDMNKKLSKGYEGKVSEIVKKLYEDVEGLESKKKINIEETKNKTKFISNFWAPTKCLQFMADQALNMQDSPSYTFFENKYGFHFVSLMSLYQGTPVKQRFLWSNYTSEVKPTGSSADSLDKDYQAVMELTYEEGFNYMDKLKSGMFGSEIIYYDIMTQQYVHKGWAPTWDPKKSLNKYPLWTDKVVSKSRAVLIHDHQYYNAFEDYAEVSNTKMHQERRSLMAQAEGHRVTMNVLGRMDYSAGQRVYLEVPKNKQVKEKEEDPMDQLLTGYYLIGAICHFINREKHECTIELIKDSYITELK